MGWLLDIILVLFMILGVFLGVWRGFFGSLAKTGKGHGTDTVIVKTFAPVSCEIEFNMHDDNLPHPNTMILIAFKDGVEIAKTRVFSVGGGYIEFENMSPEKLETIYPHDKFTDIAAYCEDKGIKLWQYALEFEGQELKEHIATIWDAMKRSIKKGLNDEGVLPGGLDVQKKAKTFDNFRPFCYNKLVNLF